MECVASAYTDGLANRGGKLRDQSKHVSLGLRRTPALVLFGFRGSSDTSRHVDGGHGKCVADVPIRLGYEKQPNCSDRFPIEGDRFRLRLKREFGGGGASAGDRWSVEQSRRAPTDCAHQLRREQ